MEVIDPKFKTVHSLLVSDSKYKSNEDLKHKVAISEHGLNSSNKLLALVGRYR